MSNITIEGKEVSIPDFFDTQAIQKQHESFQEFVCEWQEFEKGDPIFAMRNNKYLHPQMQDDFELWQRVKAQAVPEWISVGDSLPPVDETVLVCWDYAADIEPEKEYLTLDEDYNEYWPNCQDEPPTHWLPLPKVIKAQEPAND